ncbi:TniQ family protein [Aliiroseovarius sp. S1339]|uniref:TniQ family protein n=1 Tax=Aliiroseovarius sp. S1339 TaxID=2936990 RepID=UPI0020BE0740|nr:TniQ family protein [Aliiroseovarius sp. S1339]MCK8463068.1 TniQ family protein [Aliiroseovarius sp. S1339]
MTLWPSLPYNSEETLLSFADRLSVMHTGCGMERLLRDLGINIEHFISGREEAVGAFAEASGLRVHDVQKGAIRVFPRGASFRGEYISKTFLSPRAARYCPSCLAEDGQMADHRFRLIWGFRHVARCDRHSSWLVDAAYKNETSLRLAMGSEMPEEPQAAKSGTPDYLFWLRTRLDGGSLPGNHWIDSQTLEQVLAASEMLGATLEHGHRVATKKLSAAQTEEATDIGFSIYREGLEAVADALDTIRMTSPASAVQAGPLAHYGKLYDWLHRRSNTVDPGPIRDILRDHIVKNSAVEPGTKVLGVEVTERKYHTLQSLSAEVDIPRVRLSRVLKRLGQLPEDATEVDCGNAVFEAAKTVPMVEAFKSAVRLQDVPDYLGASKGQFEALYRIDIVKPLIPRTGRGSVRHVVFSRAHLDDFLRSLEELPLLADDAEGDFHPIAYACQRGAGLFEDVFVDIQAGKICGYRHSDKVGIGSVYVDVSSLSKFKKSA